MAKFIVVLEAVVEAQDRTQAEGTVSDFLNHEDVSRFIGQEATDGSKIYNIYFGKQPFDKEKVLLT